MPSPVRKNALAFVAGVNGLFSLLATLVNFFFWSHQPYNNLSDISGHGPSLLVILLLYCIAPVWVLGIITSYRLIESYFKTRAVRDLSILGIVWLVGFAWIWFALGMLATG